MSQTAIQTLEALRRLHLDEAERLEQPLVEAVAVLSSAIEAERSALDELDQRRQALARSDERGRRELLQGCTAARVAERAAFGARLSVELETAQRGVASATAQRQRAETAQKTAQRALAEASGACRATEEKLTRARREAQRRADDRVDEELADLVAVRRSQGLGTK